MNSLIAATAKRYARALADVPIPSEDGEATDKEIEEIVTVLISANEIGLRLAELVLLEEQKEKND